MKEFVFYCVIGIYINYAQISFLKDKKNTTITNAFQKILDGLKRKLNTG